MTTHVSVPVTVRLTLISGIAGVVGQTVTATLDRDDHDGAGFINASQATGVVDAAGTVVFILFPNKLPPDGLGTRGSRYVFACRAISWRTTAQVPNWPCELHEISD